MEIQDHIEFYLNGKLFKRVRSSMRLQEGDYISIRRESYKIKRVSYALDYSDTEFPRMRLNAEIVAV